MAKLVCQSGPTAGHEYKLTKDLTVMGRQSTCDIQIMDSMSSRAHCHIRRDGKLYSLIDLGSRNGTSLNGRKVGERKLEYGDRIRIGEAEYQLVKEPGDLELKDLLTKYTLGEKLGEGGMGIVYKATQRSMARAVALKILAPKYASRPKFVDQFIREARAAGQLNHPNIIQVHDVGTENEIHYFSMEFVDGSTCMQLLRGDGAFNVEEALEITRQVAKALEYAHQHRLIHQDIKPDNIMVGPNNLVKVADLGISKTFDEVTGEDAPKKVMGTPHYMAPEAALGKRIDHRVDLYSLGATLYHLLSGKTPYHGTSATEVLKAHVMDPLPPLSEINPDVPIAVVRMVEKMLAKNPDERFQSAADIIVALDAVKNDSGISEPAPSGGDTMILRRYARNTTPSGAQGPDATTSGGIVNMPPAPPRPHSVLVPMMVAAIIIVAGAVAWMMLGGPGRTDEPVISPPAPAAAQTPAVAPPVVAAPAIDPRIPKALAELRALDEQLQFQGERADLDHISTQLAALAPLDLGVDGKALVATIRNRLKAALDSRASATQIVAFSELERDLDRLADERNYDLAVRRLNAFPGRNDPLLKGRIDRKRTSLVKDKADYLDSLRRKVRDLTAAKDFARLRELQAGLPPALLGSEIEQEIQKELKTSEDAAILRWNKEVAAVAQDLVHWDLEAVAGKHRLSRQAMGSTPPGQQFDAYLQASVQLGSMVKAIAAKLEQQRDLRYIGTCGGWKDPDLIGATDKAMEIRTAGGGRSEIRWHALAPADLTAIAAFILGKEVEPFRAALATLASVKVPAEK